MSATTVFTANCGTSSMHTTRLVVLVTFSFKPRTQLPQPGFFRLNSSFLGLNFRLLSLDTIKRFSFFLLQAPSAGADFFDRNLQHRLGGFHCLHMGFRLRSDSLDMFFPIFLQLVKRSCYIVSLLIFLLRSLWSPFFFTHVVAWRLPFQLQA